MTGEVGESLPPLLFVYVVVGIAGAECKRCAAGVGQVQAR